MRAQSRRLVVEALEKKTLLSIGRPEVLHAPPAGRTLQGEVVFTGTDTSGIPFENGDLEYDIPELSGKAGRLGAIQSSGFMSVLPTPPNDSRVDLEMYLQSRMQHNRYLSIHIGEVFPSPVPLGSRFSTSGGISVDSEFGNPQQEINRQGPSYEGKVTLYFPDGLPTQTGQSAPFSVFVGHLQKFGPPRAVNGGFS